MVYLLPFWKGMWQAAKKATMMKATHQRQPVKGKHKTRHLVLASKRVAEFADCRQRHAASAKSPKNKT